VFNIYVKSGNCTVLFLLILLAETAMSMHTGLCTAYDDHVDCGAYD